MIDVYTWITDNGYKARHALEESGLPYTLHRVSLPKREQFSPDYTAAFTDMLARLDKRLSDGEYVAGNRNTVADISIYPDVHLHGIKDIGLADYANLKRWPIGSWRLAPGPQLNWKGRKETAQNFLSRLHDGSCLCVSRLRASALWPPFSSA